MLYLRLANGRPRKNSHTRVHIFIHNFMKFIAHKSRGSSITKGREILKHNLRYHPLDYSLTFEQGNNGFACLFS